MLKEKIDELNQVKIDASIQVAKLQNQMKYQEERFTMVSQNSGIIFNNCQKC